MYHNAKPVCYTAFDDEGKVVGIENNKFSLRIWLNANGLKLGRHLLEKRVGDRIREHAFAVL